MEVNRHIQVALYQKVVDIYRRRSCNNHLINIVFPIIKFTHSCSEKKRSIRIDIKDNFGSSDKQRVSNLNITNISSFK